MIEGRPLGERISSLQFEELRYVLYSVVRLQQYERQGRSVMDEINIPYAAFLMGGILF